MEQKFITVKGARVHNLKNIDLKIPRDKLVVFTGLSGSGKSTIAVELEKMLNDAGKAVYLLDGDNIRHGINSDYFIISPDLTVICCWDII